ncbi:MAG: phospho-N-acetylmuramoyl-pentapeptide-transferase [Actinobacteria bacterium]|nr:phospho-N-acetylmuramoyl-pentapeptide-transferase [Actinomycetota bacterium]
MIALLIAAGVAFAVAVLGTPMLIRLLRKWEIGQLIRDDGPFTHPHANKAGTPTMGGIAVVVAVGIGYATAHLRGEELKFARSGLTLMALIVGMGLVGFIDDYLAVRRRRNLGLRKRGKAAGEVLVASGFALLALNWVMASTNLSFTRQLDLNLGTTGWFVFAVFVIVGSGNAVNLTDGLDGLAAGAATLTFGAFMVICFWQFRHTDIYQVERASTIDIAVVAAALTGACAGFLWWNAAPARIFMGDTGSLAIGAAMAGLALFSNVILLLPILGGLYVIETLSVIAQVISFRGFKRRILRMAPIHHHFEVSGWPEFTIIVRFWLFAGVLVALALGFFYGDFVINFPEALV